MQVNAYYEDTYEEQADTRVIAVGERDGAPWVALEHCLFHPQGGGQPADRGWVDDHEIVPVRDHETGLIVARAAGDDPLPAFGQGQRVKARIDLTTRTAHAALHTAGHLVEAAGRAQGWVLAANNHFPGQARIEFTAPTPDARLDTPEGREAATEALRGAIAEAIERDLPVTAEYDAEGLRIIRLGDLHSAPCGGTHVRGLGDLDEVVLPTLKVKRGRIRVSYSAAHRER
ncbi:metal-dependent hydrolase [Streptomyces olivochromogenes]|uniref:metal-dependent hydrolase n=1 Tax=Streptomyces olivochromogenes TaxID=1963 RepID=UPI001F3C2F90|nr:metal-dependent hydrolase [Streptomyces olivochromogenes]MCF3136378.1 metal-dependent hydrolase [Streptomyces olivochromogenes]